MDAAGISTVLGPFLPGPLSEDQLGQISTYLELLLRWNARVNLTSVRDPEHIVTRHFGESLFAASHLFPGSANDAAVRFGGTPSLDKSPYVVDIGSGAGFPGLPIRIFAPHVRLTLIESNHKKVAFIREVCRTLRLMHVDVFAGRAKDFPSTADVVTLRAVERFESALPVAARLVTPNGRLALLIGSRQVPVASHLPGFAWLAPCATPQSDDRVLLIGTKNSTQGDP